MSDQIPVEFDEEVEEIDPFDMICGDDISRIPETTKPDFACNNAKEVEEATEAEEVVEEPSTEVEEVVEEPSTEVEEVVEEPSTEDIEEIDPFDMICGDDISRIPETTKPDLKCNQEKEEEPMSYAAAARSRPTSECNPEEAPVVEDVVEDPVVEDVAAEPVQAAAAAPQAAPVEAEEQKQSRAERKTKKAMMKLGLTAVEGINRVVLRKDKTLLFVVPNPEVFRKGDTWVVLGEARVEDPNQRAREMAAKKMAEQQAVKTPAKAVPTTISEEDEEGENVPADGVEEKDIELVMQQAGCTRAKAIAALKTNGNDIVNAIMELTI